MFSRARDASKVALVRLVDGLATVHGGLLDVQWTTPHLVNLGAIEYDRDDYLRLLEVAIAQPGPACFEPGRPTRQT